MVLPMAWTAKYLMACSMGRQLCLKVLQMMCTCALCVLENGAANGVDHETPNGSSDETAGVSLGFADDVHEFKFDCIAKERSHRKG
eukprot:scaffold78655_cov21-Tisochrysis_lutea.AAC.1